MSNLDNLIDYIQEGTVVPIIGRDLLLFDLGGETVPLYTYLARRLSQDMGYEPPIDDLNEVAIRLREKPAESVHTLIHRILKKETLPIPEPLRQLAAIKNFSLYISLTFDTFLQRALDELRFAGENKTESTVYRCKHRHDLPEEYSFDWNSSAMASAVHVYHLLGRHEITPQSYPVTEENLLEYFHHLQKERPERLLHGLRQKNLLVLGCSLPDWLTRLFLRLVAPGRLSAKRDRFEFLADDGLTHNPSSKHLVYFLEHFSKETVIFADKGACDFVADLYRTWCAERGSRAQGASQIKTTELAVEEKTTEGHEALFLSYSKQDLNAAKKIHMRLSSEIPVWFDDQKLKIGDDWKSEIKKKIETCYFFMPVISQRALQRPGRPFFKREWKWAHEEAGGVLSGEDFLMPVVIDDTPAEKVPEEMRGAHIIHSPGGELPDEVVSDIRKKYREAQRLSRGA